MNRKELKLIKSLIRDNEDIIAGCQQDIQYYRKKYEGEELKEKVGEQEYFIKQSLNEITTLQSIYRIVKEALKNGKTN